MRIAVIGVGNIGMTIARKLVAAGHAVGIANSRGPETIAELASEIGAFARSADSVVKDAEAIILSIPFISLPSLRTALSGARSGVPVLDTSNYYPVRDGQIAELDAGGLDSDWVAHEIQRPVIKAWNAVLWGTLADKGRPKGEPGRLALPVAGDDPRGKAVALELVEATGFDAVDVGGISESWRIQPGTPAFCGDLNSEQLHLALTLADRDLAPLRRDIGIDGIAAMGDASSDDILHLYRALTKSPARVI